MRWRACVVYLYECVGRKKTGLPNTCAHMQRELIIIIITMGRSLYYNMYILYIIHIYTHCIVTLLSRVEKKNNNIMSSYARIHTIEHKHNINNNEFT